MTPDGSLFFAAFVWLTVLTFGYVAPAWCWVNRHRIAETWREHRACGMRLRTAWVPSSPNVHNGENFDRLTAESSR